ncbi:MAG: bifunctional glutamate N-acetyltransferase/amino-acid acetyltransferase ArgJ [Actinobacteria bacterium]|nr:bifunctional glutamate N-acetyltransferase/amino-acid acetyltransferase ArgJ [Actinomycetota bacterium]
MSLSQIPGGVCVPQRFGAGATRAGLKASGELDLALIVSELPASAAAVFTSNQVVAAPVLVSRAALRSGTAQGVVVNAGCANACTGEVGLAHAGQMAAAAANAVGMDPDQMLVCSTGKIGSFLPMDKVLAGIGSVAASLGAHDDDVARAIMTTDTVPKLSAVAHDDGWKVGGIAKGAGMVCPDMATTLGFVTTDAEVDTQQLQVLLKTAADQSFNAITVDGDTSTNDTLLVLANGASGIRPDPEEFAQALTAVCRSLSSQVVADGEGATKLITVIVNGAAEKLQAREAARAVAQSLLVKTSLYGQDANWGRIASAVGNSGVQARFDELTIKIADVTVLEAGKPAGPEEVDRARSALSSYEITIACSLGVGGESAEILTTDLTPEYVRINAEYEL